MTLDEDKQTVAVDASVVINLIQVERLNLLGTIGCYHFVLPDHVVSEVSYPEQAAVMQRALKEGQLVSRSITDLVEMTLLAELRQRMGAGEAACLAMAVQRNWMVASDDRGRAFLRLARERIGEARLIDTDHIVQVALREKIIRQAEAERLLQKFRS